MGCQQHKSGFNLLCPNTSPYPLDLLSLRAVFTELLAIHRLQFSFSQPSTGSCSSKLWLSVFACVSLQFWRGLPCNLTSFMDLRKVVDFFSICSVFHLLGCRGSSQASYLLEQLLLLLKHLSPNIPSPAMMVPWCVFECSIITKLHLAPEGETALQLPSQGRKHDYCCSSFFTGRGSFQKMQSSATQHRVSSEKLLVSESLETKPGRKPLPSEFLHCITSVSDSLSCIETEAVSTRLPGLGRKQ